MEGSSSRNVPSSLRSSALTRSSITGSKRDSLAAELEKDPQLSSAKRQQRNQAFSSSLAQSSLERQLLTIKTAKMELESKLREKEMYIERLERDRRWLSDREAEEKAEKEKERLEREQEKRKSDTDLRSVRAQLLALQEEHADLQDTHSSSSRNSSQTINTQKSRISTLEHQLSLLQEELSQSQQLADSRLRTMTELQERIDDIGTPAANRSQAEETDMGIIREELHRQAKYLRTLESTNTKLTAEVTTLRERHASVEVLREEKRGLERKLRTLEEMRERVVRLEAEVEAGRQEREDWASKSMEVSISSPAKTPISITQSLSDLRLAHARLLEEHGATNALLKSRESELRASEERESQAEDQIRTLRSEVRSLKDAVARHTQQTALSERELGFMQALLASFTAENQRDAEAVDINEVLSERIQQLEQVVQQYKERNEQLLTEINQMGEDSNTIGEGRSRKTLAADIETEKAQQAELASSLTASQEECKQLVERIDELEQELFELKGEIAGGRHVPPGVRILTMKENPVQEWVDLRQSAMDRLRQENDALLTRLKELEESGVHKAGQENEDLVPRASWESLNQEKEAIAKELALRVKKTQRLTDVFRQKSHEFTDAVSAIVGYKFAFYPNGNVRVTSMYDLNASFVFQPVSQQEGEKTWILIAQSEEEGGPEDLADLMRYWLAGEQNVPCFTASVSLGCYDVWKHDPANRTT